MSEDGLLLDDYTQHINTLYDVSQERVIMIFQTDVGLLTGVGGMSAVVTACVLPLSQASHSGYVLYAYALSLCGVMEIWAAKQYHAFLLASSDFLLGEVTQDDEYIDQIYVPLTGINPNAVVMSFERRPGFDFVESSEQVRQANSTPNNSPSVLCHNNLIHSYMTNVIKAYDPGNDDLRRLLRIVWPEVQTMVVTNTQLDYERELFQTIHDQIQEDSEYAHLKEYFHELTLASPVAEVPLATNAELNLGRRDNTKPMAIRMFSLAEIWRYRVACAPRHLILNVGCSLIVQRENRFLRWQYLEDDHDAPLYTLYPELCCWTRYSHDYELGVVERWFPDLNVCLRHYLSLASFGEVGQSLLQSSKDNSGDCAVLTTNLETIQIVLDFAYLRENFRDDEQPQFLVMTTLYDRGCKNALLDIVFQLISYMGTMFVSKETQKKLNQSFNNAMSSCPLFDVPVSSGIDTELRGLDVSAVTEVLMQVLGGFSTMLISKHFLKSVMVVLTEDAMSEEVWSISKILHLHSIGSLDINVNDEALSMKFLVS